MRLCQCLAALLIVAGCGGDNAPTRPPVDVLVGAWRVPLDAVQADGTRISGNFVLNLYPDHSLLQTATITRSDVQPSRRGTWAVNGDRLIITYEDLGYDDLEPLSGIFALEGKDVVVFISDDGSTSSRWIRLQ